MADVAQIDVPSPLPPLLPPGGVEHGALPCLAVKFKKTLDGQARFPKQVMQIVLVPVQNLELRLTLLEVKRARQRREDGKTHPVEFVGFDEVPQLGEVFLGEIRIHDEITGHAKAALPGHADGIQRLRYVRSPVQ
ncbi:MAG: hypothetical protein ABSA27_14490 [Terriglobales bacterium]|jgi:hypothetical protein